MSKKVKIGLFGFGCVGQGLYDVLENSKGFSAEIVKIAVKDRNKQRSLPAHYFTYDKNDILTNPEINLVVELIDDAEEAYHIVTAALKSGKNVVTANKKLLAEHLEELVQLQEKYNASLLYEASACGSIPIVRTLEEYYDNELLHGVAGIFNGSSNYILSKVINENLDYNTALKNAQDLGFAESDPTLDVGGYDALYKLVILAAHSYGVFINPNEVFNYGIQHLTEQDIAYAKANQLKIKLVAKAQKVTDEEITLFVLPQLVPATDQLYTVENEYNGVTVEAAFSDQQLFIGKGAGGHPTGSAVLSDISANSYGYKYEYKKYHQPIRYTYSKEVALEVYLRYDPEKLPNFIHFEAIKERGSNYIIGTIELQTLINSKEALEKAGAFIAATGSIKKLNAPLELIQPQELELV